MRKVLILTMYILLFTCLSCIVQGYYYGDKATVYSIDNCNPNLTISVSGVLSIIRGEYNFSACTEQSKNYWICNCNGAYNIVMETYPNTKNNYTLDIEWYEPYEVVTSSGGGSSGGGGHVKHNETEVVITNVSRVIPPTMPSKANDTNKPSTQTPPVQPSPQPTISSKNETVKSNNQDNFNWKLALGIAVGVIIVIIFIVVIVLGLLEKKNEVQ